MRIRGYAISSIRMDTAGAVIRVVGIRGIAISSIRMDTAGAVVRVVTAGGIRREEDMRNAISSPREFSEVSSSCISMSAVSQVLKSTQL